MSLVDRSVQDTERSWLYMVHRFMIGIQLDAFKPSPGS